MTPTELRDVVVANIAQRRRELGLTQVAAAARADITQASWARIEAGNRRPSLDVLAKMSIALDTTPGTLLSRDSFSG